MNIVFHNFYQELNKNNFLFENDNVPGVGEGLLTPFKVLRDIARNKNIIVGTFDYFNPKDEISAYYFLDLPKDNDPVFLKAVESEKPLYLVLLESPIIKPQNYNKKNHEKFSKVFTWSPDLLDVSGKYIRFFIPQNPKKLAFKFNFLERKLITMITSKKKSTLPNELYSEREKAIDFFDEYFPGQFDLYGNGWDKDVYAGYWKFLNVFNKLKINLPFRFQKNYKSYLGKVDSKLLTMSQYRFSICFENFGSARGYITEKIFDSMLAGCIPVYLGAPDVSEFIPKDCFVDMREFKNYQELSQFLNSINENDFNRYLSSIDTFLTGESAKKFFPEFFAENLLSVIQ